MTRRRFMPYPPVPASSAVLGFNVSSEFTDFTALDYAKAGGATIVRCQPSWGGVETYASSTLAMPAGWDASIVHCAAIGLKPLFVAGYGPPATDCLNQGAPMTITVDAPVGSTVLTLSGDLSDVTPPTAYVNQYYANPIVPAAHWNYQGALITAVNVGAKTVTLAAATNIHLAIGTQMWFRKIKYAAQTDQSLTDTGIVAYLRYATFLANQIAAGGAQGYVELWNEYPWDADRWDSRAAAYDTPGGVGSNGLFFSLLAVALRGPALPAGVRFISGVTDSAGGSSSIVNQVGMNPTPTQIRNTISYEGMHLYAGNPEGHSWDTASTDAIYGAPYWQALNPTIDQTSAFRSQDYAIQQYANANGGIRPGVMATELGAITADDTRQAVFNLRRVISCWGLNIPPVIYALFAGAPLFNVAVNNAGTFTPRPSYTALKRLMTIIGSIGTGVSSRAHALPTVIGCPDVAYPPLMVGVYGSTGAVVFVWQRTWTSGDWYALSAPGSVNVPFALPSGYTLAEATDVLTGSAVTTSTVGNVLTVPVTESPLALRFA